MFSFELIDPFPRINLNLLWINTHPLWSQHHVCFYLWIIWTLCFCVSFPEVVGEERRVSGAGGGPCGVSCAGQRAHRLCAAAAAEPGCSLAAHHHHRQHGLLSALRPERCETLLLSHFTQRVNEILFFRMHYYFIVFLKIRNVFAIYFWSFKNVLSII